MPKTYLDQEQVELYDNYDKESEETVPAMLEEARVIRDSKYVKVVDIDYPVVNGTWSLAGKKGRSSYHEDAGKKAFVRNDYYVHPYKGWTSRIVYMTPLEYIQESADIFSRTSDKEVTVDELVKDRISNYDLDAVFGPLKGNLFYLVLDKSRGNQEGLHRAVWAMMNDEEVVPVVIIEK